MSASYFPQKHWKQLAHALVYVLTTTFAGWHFGGKDFRSMLWAVVIGLLMWASAGALGFLNPTVSLSEKEKEYTARYFSGLRGTFRFSLLYTKRIGPFLLLVLIAFQLLLIPGDMGQRIAKATPAILQFPLYALLLTVGGSLLTRLYSVFKKDLLITWLVKSRILRRADLQTIVAKTGEEGCSPS